MTETAATATWADLHAGRRLGQRGERLHWAGLVLLLLVYTAVYAAYFPRIHGIKDEAGFINQALLWSRGLPPDFDLRTSPIEDLVFVGGKWVSWRNPGRSLLILPLLPFRSTEVLYGSSLLLHLASTLAAAALLRRLRRSPLWAALVLFHPTLSLYSRTLMADGAAGLCLTLAVLALTGRRHPGFLAGLALGVGAIFRYQVGLLLPFLAAGICFTSGLARPRRQALLALAGGLAVGLPLFLYNQQVFGQVLGYTGRGPSRRDTSRGISRSMPFRSSCSGRACCWRRSSIARPCAGPSGVSRWPCSAPCCSIRFTTKGPAACSPGW